MSRLPVNDQPDDFGATVRLGACVQRLAHGGDVVLTESILDDEVPELLGGAIVYPSQMLLRGGVEPVRCIASTCLRASGDGRCRDEVTLALIACTPMMVEKTPATGRR